MDGLIKLTLILVGMMSIWYSESTARQLVQSKRVPEWMPVGVIRSISVVLGILAIVSALKLLFWA